MFIFNPQREREREHSDAHILPIRIQSITSPKTKFKAKKSKEKLEGKKSYWKVEHEKLEKKWQH